MPKRLRDCAYSSFTSLRPASESSCKSRRQGSSCSAETSQANSKLLLAAISTATAARHLLRIPFFVWSARLDRPGGTFRCELPGVACTILKWEKESSSAHYYTHLPP